MQLPTHTFSALPSPPPVSQKPSPAPEAAMLIAAEAEDQLQGAQDVASLNQVSCVGDGRCWFQGLGGVEGWPAPPASAAGTAC